MEQEALDFFSEYPWFNTFVGDPLKSGKVSLVGFVATFIAIYVLYRIYRIIKKHPKSSNSEFAYELLTAPITGAMKISAALLKDAIREHYESGFSAFMKKYWLQIIGAAIVSVLVYGTAVSIVILSQGISLKSAAELYNGDWNSRFAFAFTFVRSNVYLSTAMLSVYVFLVIYYARTTFLERKYMYLRQSGIKVAFPVGEWDETPKLNVPKGDLVQFAQNSVKTLISERNVDFIRVKLASGFDSIGPDGHLTDLLKRPNVRWNILLIDPDSEGAMRRAESYMSARASDSPLKFKEEYLDSIRAVIDHLKHLKAKYNNNICVRLYPHTPQWRLFLFSGLGIVSAFGPGQRSDRAPMLVLENSSTSLFHGFEEMYEEIWQHGSTKIL